MKVKKQLMVWMIGSSILGLALNQGEVATAEIRGCPGAASIAGIDFSDCKMMSVGNPKPNVERFKLSMARQLTVMIAQYNTAFAIAYGSQTVNGLIAVRYEPSQTQVASSISNLSCAAECAFNTTTWLRH